MSNQTIMPEHSVQSEHADAAGTTEASDAARQGESADLDRLLAPGDVRTWDTPWQHEMQIKREVLSGNLGVWGRLLLTPVGAVGLGLVLLVALLGYSLGAAFANGGQTSPTTSSTSSSSSMSGMSSSGGASATQSNVPNATQQYGNQPAPFTIDPDGAKHFTLTTQQVMWEPVKGQRVLAWTLGGTVPGPMIHVTAGDHVRITIINHFPEPTAIHWHGLEVQTENDGVPPLGMKPIQPGESYTYDYTIHDEDAGTHWYHSHYDDLKQVGGGLYGAFIIEPRPGTPQAAAAAVHTDIDQTIFIGSLGPYYVMNGKSFPDTQPIEVKHGQTVRLRLIGADAIMMHPMHLHGHTFSIIAEDGHMLTNPILKDTVQVAPGESYDVTFTAWAAPGSMYPFHCHILSHVMNPGQTGSEMGGLIMLLKYAK